MEKHSCQRSKFKGLKVQVCAVCLRNSQGVPGGWTVVGEIRRAGRLCVVLQVLGRTLAFVLRLEMLEQKNDLM